MLLDSGPTTGRRELNLLILVQILLFPASTCPAFWLVAGERGCLFLQLCFFLHPVANGRQSIGRPPPLAQGIGTAAPVGTRPTSAAEGESTPDLALCPNGTSASAGCRHAAVFHTRKGRLAKS
jgi:hypothetical protein